MSTFKTWPSSFSSPFCPSPPVSIKLRMLKSRTTYFLLRYRTKCKRLEREAEQGLSAHPQEPLVCDTLYSTSLCVLVLYLVLLQHVLTHFNLCVVFLQKEMKEIKELRAKVAKLVSKLQEEAEQRQVSQRDWNYLLQDLLRL